MATVTYEFSVELPSLNARKLAKMCSDTTNWGCPIEWEHACPIRKGSCWDVSTEDWKEFLKQAKVVKDAEG